MHINSWAIAVEAAADSVSAFPVWAQELPATQRDPTSSHALAVVTVAAQKRGESIRKIPYSISSTSGADLESSHIDNFEDFTRTIVSASFAAGVNAGIEAITMCGISSIGGGATVDQYLHDMPVIAQTFFDPATPLSQGVPVEAESIGQEVYRLSKSPFTGWRCSGALIPPCFNSTKSLGLYDAKK